MPLLPFSITPPQTEISQAKLAVLIDADNTQPGIIEGLLNEIAKYGIASIKRIYGDWTNTNLRSWKDRLLEYAIQPIQQFSYTTGKNATDSAMIIDAMDLLYSERINGFCITASDSDYTRLATRLKESEMYVLGMGEQKTPRAFINACSAFKYLDALYAANKQAVEVENQNAPAPGKNNAVKKNPAPAKEPPVSDANSGSDINAIKQALRQITNEYSDEDGWIFSGKLGSFLNKQYPDFDVRNFGYLKFNPFINSLKLFETKQDETKLVYFKVKITGH